MKSVSSEKPTLASMATYQAGIMQSSAYRVLKKFTDSCLKEHGLTTMQWFIVGLVYEAGDKGARINELSIKLGTNMPYITNALNLLESKDIIERFQAKGDGRGKRARLAETYRPNYERIEVDLRDKMRSEIYAHIEPEQLKTYLMVTREFTHLVGSK